MCGKEGELRASVEGVLLNVCTSCSKYGRVMGKVQNPFAKQTKSLCEQDAVTVLYFFSSDSACPSCEEQSFVLTYLKKQFGDRLLNFALDEAYEDEPMISILRRSYELKEFPTLIVEGDVYEGFTSSDDLLAAICSHYFNPPAQCSDLSN